MDDRYLQTARVRWRMGQPLLPEHFYCQEESLRAETDLRLTQSALPQWGVGDLAWEVSPTGRVRIRRLVVIHDDGTVIDVPGNCDPPEAIDVSAEGQGEVPLYLHFDGASRFTKESPHGDTDNVERTVLQVKVAAHPSSDPDAEPFKLAILKKSVDDEWDLDPTFVPPTLRVAAMPFFRTILRRLRKVVDALHEALVEEIRDAFLSSETISSARQCLRGVFSMQSILTDLQGDVDMHPADLWRAVTALYLDVCVHRGISPGMHRTPYRHRQIGECFSGLLDAIEDQVAIRKAETPHANFAREGNMFVCNVPDEARRARQVFWLIQKNRVGDNVHLGQVKLASPQRLSTVHQLALRGIPFRPIMNPPFHHDFTAEVEFYALDPGDEWDHALRESKVAYYARDELEGVNAFIYWRND